MLTVATQLYRWEIAGSFGLAAIGAYIGGFIAMWVGRRLRIMDEPGSRSSHTIPTPRTGGMAILFGTLVGLSLSVELTVSSVIGAVVGAVITGVSLLDDIITIRSLPRLALHFLAAGLVVYLVGLQLNDIGLPYIEVHLSQGIGFLLAMVFVVAFVNFFNFMDGINGIGAAQGIFGGLTLAILLAWGHGGTDGPGNSFLYGAGLAGGCLGFLPHNFPKARLFMGDIGSTTIGFVLAALTLVGAQHATLDGVDMPWVCFVLPLGVFIYDATFTLLKRISRGENFLKAHREHHYQLLVRSGWSHTKVTVLQMGLMALCSAGALAYAGGSDAVRLAVLVVLLTVMVTYSVLVHRYFRIHRTDDPAEETA